MGTRGPREVRRGARRTLLAGALLLLALLPAPCPGRAEEAEEEDGAPAAPAPAEEQAEAETEPEAAPARVPYEAVYPRDRRGRTIDPAELRSDPSEPSFGPHTDDLDEHRGDSRELRELSRRPGPLPPEEEEEFPAPLRLRRPPGEEPLRDAPLAARLCGAEDDLAHARAQLVDAVAAYKRARRAEYPRGDNKFLVVKRRELAVNRLGRAEAALDALLAEADEQGVAFDPADCPSSG